MEYTLALLEIGLDMQLASELVNYSVGITEETLRKRVAQTFGVLRVRVLRNYMGLFVRGWIEEELLSGGGGRVDSTVQVGMCRFWTGYSSWMIQYGVYCRLSWRLGQQVT